MQPDKQLSEDRIQSEIVTYFHNNHRETRYCIWHVPNGGSRDPREANKLVATGVVPGIEDIHVFWQGKMYFIEVKEPGGPVQPSQKACHAMHAAQGSPTFIVRDYKDGINLIYCIIKNKPLDRFNNLISPFAIPEMYEQYQKEAIEHRAKLKAQRSARANKAKSATYFF